MNQAGGSFRNIGAQTGVNQSFPTVEGVMGCQVGDISGDGIPDLLAGANLDDSVELGTRNIKVALRRLRKFAREGAADQLDLEDTIDKTARNAGLLDIRMVPERHNAVKVLLCLDIGGSMDDHVKVCEELFSAARSEFKHLEYFYFHNFVYESMWKDNRRRHNERMLTNEITHKKSDYLEGTYAVHGIEEIEAMTATRAMQIVKGVTARTAKARARRKRWPELFCSAVGA